MPSPARRVKKAELRLHRVDLNPQHGCHAPAPGS